MRIHNPLFWLIFGMGATYLAGADLTDGERGEFYHLEEGSEVVPLQLVRPLNSIKGKPFLEDLDRFGLIEQQVSVHNPEGLPIGLTAGSSKDIRVVANMKMLGVNCSACHVAEISYQGKSFIVDGAPSRFDIEGFYRELAASIKTTLTDRKLLAAYMWRLLTANMGWAGNDGDNQMFRAMARRTLTLSIAPENNELMNDIVALAERESKLVPNDVSADQFRDGLELRTADADRTGTPSLDEGDFESMWRKHGDQLRQLEKYGWKPSLPGMVESTRSVLQALELLRARLNFLIQLSGQDTKGTLGLNGRTDAFGHARNFIFGAKSVRPTTAPVDFPPLWGFSNVSWVHYDGNTNSVLERNLGQAIGLGAVFTTKDYSSTLLPRNIHRLEVLARKINAPKWPENIFGKIDTVSAEQGRGIYKEKCANCHAPAGTGGDFQDFSPKELRTDPLRVDNFGEKLGDGKPFESELAKVLAKLKQMAAKSEGITDVELNNMESGRKPVFWRATGKYFARPLVGVWSSPPYLHNGSIPNLTTLLSKVREPKFLVGSKEYDPVNVGYVSKGVDTGVEKTFDTALPGNSNAGHDYGTELEDVQKLHLIEYLKTL